VIALLASEFRLMWRPLIWWVIGVVFIVLLTVVFFPSVQASPGFDEMMEQLPESVRPLIGTIDITSPAGYLLSQLYVFFLPTVIFVYAIGRGSATIAGEEEAGTLDLLLAQPISRTMLYATKTLAVALGTGFLVLASWLPIQLIGPLFNLNLPAWDLIAVTINLFLLSLLFAGIALAVAAALGRRMMGAAVAAALAFATFLLDGFGQSIDWLQGFRPLAPWYWYDPTAALSAGEILPGAAVLASAAVVTAAIGLVAFRRRSLSS
jgi:ABC-2 type transport system permease protein